MYQHLSIGGFGYIQNTFEFENWLTSFLYYKMQVVEYAIQAT